VLKLALPPSLEDAHEQWSDASRQGAVSTILIAGARAGWIGPWEDK
jgi:hypothetical protein